MVASGIPHVDGGSFGLQIGGQSVDVVLLIRNRRGLERFLSNRVLCWSRRRFSRTRRSPRAATYATNH